jgi:hypothetical protein
MRDATVKIVSVAVAGYVMAKFLGRDFAYHWLIGVATLAAAMLMLVTAPIVTWKSKARYSFIGASFFIFLFLTVDQGFRWGYITSGRAAWFMEWPYIDVAFLSMAGLAGAMLQWSDSVGHMSGKIWLFRGLFVVVILVAFLLA